MFRIVLLVLLCANIAFSFPANPSNNDYWQQDGALYQYNSASGKWKKLNKVLYKSPFEYSSDLTDAGLQTAFTAIGATETELFIDAQYTITANLVVPANIKLKLASGASLSVDAGFTLTINGDFEAPDETVFIGLGNVSLANSALQQIKAVWYGVVSTGVVADYLVKAINNAGGKKVLLSDGTFDVSNLTDYTITQDVNLKGSANSVLDGQDNAKARMILANDTDNIIDGVQFVDFKNAIECLYINLTTFNHIDSVIITNSKISSGENGVYLRCQLDKVIIANNIISDMTQNTNGLYAVGIWVGSEAQNVEDMSKNINITGNIISNINHTFVGAGNLISNGILVEGRHANISHNNISYVKNASTLSADAEGIYTKTLYSVIDGNVLRNAGTGDASINLKGAPRGNAGALTEGYANIVSNNNIVYDDPTYVTLQTAGIQTYIGNTLITGNYIEGARHASIRTSISPAYPADNIVIQNNDIMFDESYASIYVSTNGENYVISGNTSYGARPVSANIGSTARHPIQVIGFGSTKGLMIYDNFIQEDYADFTAITSVNGIDIEPNNVSITDIKISDNSFVFSNKPAGNYYGLELDFNTIPVVNVTVQNNVLDGGLSPFSTYTKGQFINNLNPYVYTGDNWFDLLTGYNRSLVSDTGNETAVKIAYTTNKLTSGNDTGLEIVQTDTASPGTSLLIDARVGASSKFKVNNDGEANLSGISGDGAGKAVCIKADGNLGTCTDVVGAGGTCTCS